MPNESELTKGRVTLADVAREAGVSTTTASLAMRNRNDLVADKTIAHVQQVAQEINYVYNIGAASLRTQRSMMIAMVIPHVGEGFFGDIVTGIEAYLETQNYAMMLAITREDADKERQMLNMVQQRQVDGVVLSTSPTNSTLDDALNEWRGQNIPTVVIPRQVESAFDCVSPDYASGAEMATQHLLDLGYDRIAFIGGSPGLAPFEMRMQGFYNVLRSRGVQADETCMYPTPANTGNGYRAIMSLHERLKVMPKAYFCYNDHVALGAMSALQTLGMQPGVDVSVVGFDNTRDTETWYPALTTIDSGAHELGHRAAELLIARINEPDRSLEQVIIEPRLVIRNSCLYRSQHQT